MENLLEKTRKINELLQQKNSFKEELELPYNQMAAILGDTLDANTYIIDKNGSVLGYHVEHDVNNQRVKNMVDSRQFPLDYTQEVSRLPKTEVNIPMSDDKTVFPKEFSDEYPESATSIIPIFGAGERLGTIILGRISERFGADDLILAEYSATVVGMQILYERSRSIENDIRETTAVQMAINSLSYSELVAVKAIIEKLGDHDEGRITASSVADEIGITRSVIVNALRKLESAGVIESRSLGMKGTYLKIINSRLQEELAKQSV